MGSRGDSVTDFYWRTGSSAPRREHVKWPTLSQVLNQLGIVALAVGLWSILLVGYLRLTGDQGATPPAAEPEAVAGLMTPAVTVTEQTAVLSNPEPTRATPTASAMPPASTDTPSPTATDSPSPTSTPTAAPEPIINETPSPEPSSTPTHTPTPLPTPTATVTLPTSTPVPSEEAGGVSFVADVLPIFERRCVKCHGGRRTEEGLILKSYAAVMAGSWNGPVIEPGDAEGSYLMKQVTSGEMPKREPRLLPSEIQVISDWIVAGAPDN